LANNSIMAGLATFAVFMASCVFTSSGERYEAPMEKVTDSPLDVFYEYPVAGNKLMINEAKTHVFWPAEERLFSHFYMNVDTPEEKQKFFGFSQQIFGEQRVVTILPQAGHTMGATDHLGMVKAEGDWKDHSPEEGKQDHDWVDPEIDLEFVEEAKFQQKKRLVALYKWVVEAGIVKIVDTQMMLNQLPLLNDKVYSGESEQYEVKLKNDMEAFSEGIDHEHYHKFAKSAVMCLHLNLRGIPLSTEGERQGWWLPLKTSFLAWRAMTMQEPIRIYMQAFGTWSMSLDADEKNLKGVFRGGQVFRADVDDLYFNKMRLYLAPPNNIPDDRPAPPEKPSGFVARGLEYYLRHKNPASKTLPWAPREQLCPSEEYDGLIEAFTNCGTDKKKCVYRLIQLYPCMAYYVRSSTKYSHGIDSLIEFLLINHSAKEATPSMLRAVTGGKPWDDEFEMAIKVLGLDPTEAKE